ncbi:MAG: CDP-alcohol phosphatidyltransferase family protein [Candidatus Altiarchaeota archaeon]|nr:CDP-alcohol phosphatidyltransferase family protein [Candidatus Altiarchaeota archaeon]
MKEHSILNLLKAEDFLTLAAAVTSVNAIFLFVKGCYTCGTSLLIFAAIIDLLDGMIARRRNSTTDFGRNLDFLQDAITYCVAIAVLLHMTVTEPWLDPLLVLFISASIVRLARQQLMKNQERQYIGLPVTFNLTLPLMYLAGITEPLAYAAAMITLSLLMISDRTYKF